MHSILSSSKLTSLKPILASRFIKSLSKINHHKPSSSYAAILSRSRRIKVAAEASMASAAGSKRAWSRAILRKLRARASGRVLGPPKVVLGKRKRGQEPSRADELRRLVPGGEAMDFCSLLDEAADYIRCLSTQVQVMENVVDSLSL
ncbi:transcription factor IBH1-like [Tasmannia lanceolata]|uniref:transcription factor IBH1-like n=1 Tax=Tasmannia lanceolata TaxID=3420 RepID=UPI0040648CBB